MSKKHECKCHREFSVTLLRPHHYAVFKTVLDRAKHPTFVGRNSFSRNAIGGGAHAYSFMGQTIAVSLCNPRTANLICLAVIPAHRGHGMGMAVMAFLKPTWIRALDSSVGFFEKCGYRRVGKTKRGLTLYTQIMVRRELESLAVKLQRWINKRGAP